MNTLTSPKILHASLSPPAQLNVSLSGSGLINGRINKSPLGPSIHIDTVEHWNQQPDFVGEKGSLYIYSDYKVQDVGDGFAVVPGLKVGDGETRLQGLPFISSGVSSYTELLDKPSINGNPILDGDNELSSFGIACANFSDINRLFTVQEE